jgi:hypothetical protein
MAQSRKSFDIKALEAIKFADWISKNHIQKGLHDKKDLWCILGNEYKNKKVWHTTEELYEVFNPKTKDNVTI